MEKSKIVNGLGERLRKKIVETKENHSQFAKRVRLTRATLSNYLTGRSEPSLSMLLLLSNILKTNPNYLLGVGEDKPIDGTSETVTPYPEGNNFAPLSQVSESIPDELRLDNLEQRLKTNDLLLSELQERVAVLEKSL